MDAREDDHELTNSTTRLDPTQHGIARFRGRAAAEDCGARQSGTGGGGSVPGISRGAELARASGGESLQKPVVRHSDGRAIVFPPSCGSDALKLLRENRPSGMESIPAARVRSEEWQ